MLSFINKDGLLILRVQINEFAVMLQLSGHFRDRYLGCLFEHSVWKHLVTASLFLRTSVVDEFNYRLLKKNITLFSLFLLTYRKRLQKVIVLIKTPQPELFKILKAEFVTYSQWLLTEQCMLFVGKTNLKGFFMNTS